MEQFEGMKPYLSFTALEAADKSTLSPEELERYHRALMIPSSVRHILEREVDELRKHVVDLETVIDEVVDYLNGER